MSSVKVDYALNRPANCPENFSKEFLRLEDLFPIEALSEPSAQEDLLQTCRQSIDDFQVVAERIVQDVQSFGVSMLRGVPAASDIAVIALSATLGVVTKEGNGFPGQLAYDVRPRPDGVSISQTREEFPLHTDSATMRVPNEYVGLACCKIDSDAGGASILVEIDTVVAKLSDRDSLQAEDGLLRDLQEPYPWRVPDFHPDAPIMWASLLNSNGETYGARYRKEALEAGLAVQAVSDSKLKALHVFESTMQSRNLWSLFQFDVGDMILFDNRRLLHGRTAIRSGAGRWLKRTKIHLMAQIEQCDLFRRGLH